MVTNDDIGHGERMTTELAALDTSVMGNTAAAPPQRRYSLWVLRPEHALLLVMACPTLRLYTRIARCQAPPSVGT